ncbi:ArsR/SmtB family transcription factor [Kibdelosporangium phytohabitans]|uniref:ArsR family transcriptional regulator n=1 Tax=Kibdelosporangium phytohabitans TaxID=860235 RepID=A0A0N9I5L2_9PSEU|nr:winged helix-turn-helix domain-containing protein [Kibdelosporangium phytohabitans]ALG15377.1 ArsR family transcriptional regulator [Kibdelosporangium phytohabitans]MBE1463348.1 DNA-binding transcriptional ArsR family regulator [Kibdelosporangium phytohabitans]
MVRGSELAELAALLADSTRAEICLALLDGRAWTARELAGHTGMAPSTTTEHLNRLVAGGLLVERRQGRHRYVQLAGPATAQLLEHLSSFTTPAKPTTLRAVTASAALARGRTCYDHFAGRLGVAITDAMTAQGLLDAGNDLSLTRAGRAWLTGDLGIAETDLRTAERPLTRTCLDWTERRSHLAGTAGAQICRRFQENSWTRKVGSSRAVRLTPAGEQALRDLLGIDAAAVVG